MVALVPIDTPALGINACEAGTIDIINKLTSRIRNTFIKFLLAIDMQLP